MQQWRNQFVNLALNWMDVLGKQVNEWTLVSLKEDEVCIGMLSYTVLSLTVITFFPAVICFSSSGRSSWSHPMHPLPPATLPHLIQVPSFLLLPAWMGSDQCPEDKPTWLHGAAFVTRPFPLHYCTMMRPVPSLASTTLHKGWEKMLHLWWAFIL